MVDTESERSGGPPLAHPGDRCGPEGDEDRFELVDYRGGGSEGAVWEARDHKESSRNPVVAVKVYGDTVLTKNLGEAATLNAFVENHRELKRDLVDVPRGMVRILDAFAGPSPHLPLMAGSHRRAYAIMDLVNGPDLSAWLKFDPKPSLAELFDVLENPAEALKYLHDAGGVHRDIKPVNLIIATNSHGRRYGCLVDIGLVKTLSGSKIHTAGATKAYSPIDVWTGPSKASDLFSLAATILAYFRIDEARDNPEEWQAMVAEIDEIPTAAKDLLMEALAADKSSRVNFLGRFNGVLGWLHELRTTLVGVPGASLPAPGGAELDNTDNDIESVTVSATPGDQMAALDPEVLLTLGLDRYLEASRFPLKVTSLARSEGGDSVTLWVADEFGAVWRGWVEPTTIDWEKIAIPKPLISIAAFEAGDGTWLAGVDRQGAVWLSKPEGGTLDPAGWEPLSVETGEMQVVELAFCGRPGGWLSLLSRGPFGLLHECVLGAADAAWPPRWEPTKAPKMTMHIFAERDHLYAIDSDVHVFERTQSSGQRQWTRWKHAGLEHRGAKQVRSLSHAWGPNDAAAFRVTLNGVLQWCVIGPSAAASKDLSNPKWYRADSMTFEQVIGLKSREAIEAVVLDTDQRLHRFVYDPETFVSTLRPAVNIPEVDLSN